MFILGLRGTVGLRIAVKFHLLMLASGMLLYFSKYVILDISICIIFLKLYTMMIRQMINHRNELEFSGNSASLDAFPRTKKRAQLIFKFMFFLVVLPWFSTTFVILLGNNTYDPKSTIAILFGYYAGSFGLIGMMNVKMQKYEE